MMFSLRAFESTSHPPASSQAAAQSFQAQVAQDRQGPFDGELLDLYVAILIVVPFAWFLRSLWS